MPSICSPGTLHYGVGTFERLGEEAARFGSRALLVGDRTMEMLGLIDRARVLLEDAGVECLSFIDVDGEPEDRHVEAALAIARECDCRMLVGLGGGSCIDAAKAVALLAASGGDIADYLDPREHPGAEALPLIAVPTTAGTGSEGTDVTVITDTGRGIKMMIKRAALMPAVAIVDPELARSAPGPVVAATGVDALTHAIEAYLSRRAHPYTDTLALAACARIGRHLERAWRDREDLDAWSELSLGATQAGQAFSNASVGLVHGMSRPLGALFHVPHGISNAMLLPGVLEFSRRDCAPRLAELAAVLLPGECPRDVDTAADAVVAWVKRLCLHLEIPNMQRYGIEWQALAPRLDKMAEDALASGSPGNNPRIPSHAEIMTLYRHCYADDFG
ncbi:iron-containing alcohol dehydrogenase [Halotalea alkalilenta]|uniref:iron-containing alcohol dehydrogenase n=1 Tax=Halotalea alkalilenta TaxID=376489 RepID=UPI000483A763|nr:iron-containing alcohol dehydrogenase [Halotalea alkalilenta]